MIKPFLIARHVTEAEKRGTGRLTVCFFTGWCLALGHYALILQINVPALRLALFVLKCEGEHGISFLQGVFPPRIV